LNLVRGNIGKYRLIHGEGVMMVQKIAEPLKEQNEELGHRGQVATSMIDKIIGRSKADRRAIDMLDEDQKEYIKRNAKAFLAARMKKIKRRDK
jgi:hypothetical protein